MSATTCLFVIYVILFCSALFFSSAVSNVIDDDDDDDQMMMTTTTIMQLLTCVPGITRHSTSLSFHSTPLHAFLACLWIRLLCGDDVGWR